MTLGRPIPIWSAAAPAAAVLLLLLSMFGVELRGIAAVAGAMLLIGAVLAAVHHAEVVALKVGEPYGTLVLALAVTVIEAGLIVSLMLANPDTTAALARDTLYAAAMIILGGVTGACILAGAARHHVQRYSVHGANAALTTLATLAVVVLVLPNFTTSTAGPTLSAAQLVMLATVSLVLYGTFLLVQTVRHRDYFLPQHPQDMPAANVVDTHAPPPTVRAAWMAFALLLLSLVAVVFLAKGLSPVLEAAIAAAGAPKAVLGVVIAGVVLTPEGLAAVNAARADRLQTSLNLALGSALATIGLTIPVVIALSFITGLPLVLGLAGRDMVILGLTLLVSAISLATGRTTVMQGAVHLTLFGVFLFLTVVP